MVNGPVIKVYKNGEVDEDEMSQRLKYVLHMPVLKDKNGDVVEPSNMMLHNNENNLLFVDGAQRNKVMNFDLERGAIVDEYRMEKDVPNVLQLTNEFKNSQATAS